MLDRLYKPKKSVETISEPVQKSALKKRSVDNSESLNQVELVSRLSIPKKRYQENESESNLELETSYSP